MINRDKMTQQARQFADNADGIETDTIHATDSDDLMALLSHIEIAERQAGRLRDMIKATLEEREFEE